MIKIAQFLDEIPVTTFITSYKIFFRPFTMDVLCLQTTVLSRFALQGRVTYTECPSGRFRVATGSKCHDTRYDQGIRGFPLFRRFKKTAKSDY